MVKTAASGRDKRRATPHLVHANGSRHRKPLLIVKGEGREVPPWRHRYVEPYGNPRTRNQDGYATDSSCNRPNPTPPTSSLDIFNGPETQKPRPDSAPDRRTLQPTDTSVPSRSPVRVPNPPAHTLFHQRRPHGSPQRYHQCDISSRRPGSLHPPRCPHLRRSTSRGFTARVFRRRERGALELPGYLSPS